MENSEILPQGFLLMVLNGKAQLSIVIGWRNSPVGLQPILIPYESGYAIGKPTPADRDCYFLSVEEAVRAQRARFDSRVTDWRFSS